MSPLANGVPEHIFGLDALVDKAAGTKTVAEDDEVEEVELPPADIEMNQRDGTGAQAETAEIPRSEARPEAPATIETTKTPSDADAQITKYEDGEVMWVRAWRVLCGPVPPNAHA